MDKNIVALVRDDTKTVKVKFFPDKYASVESVLPRAMLVELDDIKLYKYVTTLDLKPSDLCMVYVGCAPKIVEVQVVDETLEIEPNSSVEYKWIQSKIDDSYAQQLNEQNEEMRKILEEGYRTNTRRQFREVFMQSVDQETQTKLLGIIGSGVKK